MGIGTALAVLRVIVLGVTLDEDVVVERIRHQRAEAGGLLVGHEDDRLQGVGRRLRAGVVRRARACAVAVSSAVRVDDGHVVGHSEADQPRHLRGLER